MSRFDSNCFFGEWPFRRFYHGGMEGLKAVHEKAGITGGCISSLQSIFYNDPMEAEELLAEAIAGTPYRQVMGVNPELPATEQMIREAVERFHIAGVRIYPGYHGFRLDDPCVQELAKLLAELKLPLVVTMRLEDERVNYLVTPRGISSEEKEFLPEKFPELKILYTGMQAYEVTGIAGLLAACPNLAVETSFFKSPCTIFETVLKSVPARQILYGSGYPLCCLQSTMIALETGDISEDDRAMILSGSAESFWN